jgi:hypothetical protein
MAQTADEGRPHELMVTGDAVNRTAVPACAAWPGITADANDRPDEGCEEYSQEIVRMEGACRVCPPIPMMIRTDL